jgi:hypothetical protein
MSTPEKETQSYKYTNGMYLYFGILCSYEKTESLGSDAIQRYHVLFCE